MIEYDLNEHNCDNIDNKLIINGEEYDLNEYKFEIMNKKIFIMIKEYEIKKEELLSIDLTHSQILYASIDNKEVPLAYKAILDKILIEFTAKKLKEVSLFKHTIKDGRYCQSGYYYLEKINISYRGLRANHIKKEILNLMEYLHVKFEIKIKLKNGKIVKLNIHK